MPKLLFLVTEDWYFVSHRLALGRAAVAAGYDVVVVTRAARSAKEIEAAGIRVRPVAWERGGFHPLREFRALVDIWKIYREERPDVVHHVALKPVLYGGIVAIAAPVGVTISAIAGFGYLFISSTWKARAARGILTRVLRHLLNRRNTSVIVQNPDDYRALRSWRVHSRQIVTIAGAGVDEARFGVTQPPTTGPIVVTVVARMLWDKGIGELVEAARELRNRGLPVEVRLVGSADDANPASIPAQTLRQWTQEGVVNWLGELDDIPGVWAASHIGVLPSYREGLPLSLLEAAACGRALVATDVPGCKEVIEHGVNGFLVPAKDANALADAIARLVTDAGLREGFGQASRARVKHRFTQAVVNTKILELYRELLTAKNTEAQRAPR
ncbi:MAG: glycosyltransferase involved in cell wall biosynthesis [Gammaproteobacteria bacterium]|jgi:glycosyltransferase involved in cell wall biosynthesis